MSELIDIRADNMLIRKRLLATASALALTTYIGSTAAKAGDTDRPTVWIELGGQMEQVAGALPPFSAPFMDVTPTPGPYRNHIFQNGQKPPDHAFGFEGKVSFQPEDSDWIYSAAVRFGRSHTDRQLHNQTPLVGIRPHVGNYAAPYADITSSFKDSHAVLDFSVGKDVGLGVFGREGHSTFSAGVRIAQFSTSERVDAYARPTVIPQYVFANVIFPSFTDYAMNGQAQRSFRGVGPSISWDASATLVGNRDAGEITLDWGINGALLFGRQKAVVDHETQASHRPGTYYGYYYVETLYDVPHRVARSRKVTIPNIGGFAGISVKYPNAKVSLGYRADFFFGAVDAGIDERRTKDLGFQGPFASISIGLGG